MMCNQWNVITTRMRKGMERRQLHIYYSESKDPPSLLQILKYSQSPHWMFRLELAVSAKTFPRIARDWEFRNMGIN